MSGCLTSSKGPNRISVWSEIKATVQWLMY
jgi:hypothetical protein